MKSLITAFNRKQEKSETLATALASLASKGAIDRAGPEASAALKQEPNPAEPAGSSEISIRKPKKSRLDTLHEMYAEKLPKDGECACTWDEAVQLDKSKTHKNLQWILNLIVSGNLKAEDRYKVPGMIDEMQRCAYMLKRDGVARDLNQYKSLPDLAKALKPYAEELSPAEIGENERLEIDAQTEVIHKSEGLLVVSPKSEKASCFWGRGTRWCTASTEADNEFDRYTANGKELFVFIHEGQKYQLHTDGDFFNDLDSSFSDEIKKSIFKAIPNETISKNKGLLSALRETPSLLGDIEQTEEICLHGVQINGRALEWVKKQSPQICLAAARNDGSALEWVQEQNLEICLAAVVKNGKALQWAKDQSPELSLIAVQQNAEALRWVKEQTTAVCMEAVRRDGDALRWVKNQTPEICLAAVANKGMAIDQVKEQTTEICTAALLNDGIAISRIKEQTPELCRIAVQQNGFAIKAVRDQTPELCMAAVKREPRAIRGVRDQTTEVCMAAVAQNTEALSGIRAPAPEVCFAAIEKYPQALQWISDPTPEMCLAAVQRDGLALKWVGRKTPEICMAAVQQNGHAIRLVGHPTPELLLAADKQIKEAEIASLAASPKDSPNQLTSSNAKASERSSRKVGAGPGF